MDNSKERRESVRTPFVAEGYFHLQGNDRKYTGTLRDISINGMFIELSECPDVGQKCDVAVVFQGKHSRLVIEDVAGCIVRSDEDGVAIHFAERLEWFVLIPLYFRKLRDLSQRG